MAQVVAVAGATGKQGGSVVRYLLENGDQFKIRALTRNVNSDKARELQAQGVEVVTADFGDPKTLEAAFSGCYAAFLVTNWWEHFNTDLEITQGKALADACKAQGVKHVIWSGLEDTRPALMDKATPIEEPGRTVPHFDGKAEISEYMLKEGLPVTVLNTSFYLENFLGGVKPHPMEDGTSVFTNNIPSDHKFPVHPVEELGGAVRALLKEGPSKWSGKTLGWCTDQISWADITAIMSETLGLPIRHQYLPDDQYLGMLKQFNVPGATEFVNMFMFFREGDMNQMRDLQASQVLYKGTAVKEWVQANKEKLLKAYTSPPPQH